MTQPPYGVPPQQGVPQGHPGQPPAYGQPSPPPPYLGGAPAPSGPPAGYGAPPVGFGGPGLPPPPPSAKRTIGFVMGLVTAIGLVLCILLVWLITANN